MVKVDNPVIHFAEDYPLATFAIFGIVLYTLITGGLASVKKSKSPDELPWVGIQEGQFFGLTRAAFASVTSGRDWLATAYRKAGQEA